MTYKELNTGEPVVYLYHDAGSLKELIQNERKRLSMNSVSVSFLKNSNFRNETPLYSKDYVTQLQDSMVNQQGYVNQLLGEIEVLKAQIKEFEAEKQKDFERKW